MQRWSQGKEGLRQNEVGYKLFMCPLQIVPDLANRCQQESEQNPIIPRKTPETSNSNLCLPLKLLSAHHGLDLIKPNLLGR